ncbi:MAG: T9SS type A sorting domain-containing protein [Crocinitomicaceae bacterium]|nr:T9SS type A sorting domain-containing protein [Crocinitomicaceae bacterium]
MKKQLFVLLTLFIGVTSYAQITCNPQYQDSTYGAWPDTIINFDTAYVDVPYIQVLNFKAPADAGDINPTYSGASIVSYKVTDVEGLPTGFTYTCSASNCNYPGGNAGCANLTGTATTAQIGTYNIKIKLDVKIQVAIITQDVPYEFTGYRLVIKEAPEDLNTVLLNSDEVYIYPNPASNLVTIINANNYETAEIYGVNGQLVLSHEITHVDEELNVSHLQNGVYFVHLKKGNTANILKFSKN